MLSSKLFAAFSEPTPPPSNIQFVGGKVIGNNAPSSPWTVSLTELTGGIATEPANGDLVMVVFGVTKTTSQTLDFSTSGYTKLYNNFVTAPTATNIMLGYKFMTSTPDTSVVVTSTDNTRGWSMGILVFRGVNQTTPFATNFTTATGTASNVNPPAITPPVEGTTVAVFAVAADVGVGVPLFTSNDLVAFSSAAGGLSASNVVGVGYKQPFGTNTVDPSGFGNNTGLNSWAAVSTCLNQA